jgi:cellulose synthase/poly-beta-1,6-N-acetylglucosamine synthase-like glycosyltransferase
VTDFFLLAASLAVVVALAYAIGMYLECGLVKGPAREKAPSRLLFVYLIPCLNEDRVIQATLERLTANADDTVVLVVDDASTDRTYEIVRSFPDPRVRVLHRELPDAQKGKGAALNAAIAHLATSDLLDGRSADDVVIGLLDADGRLDAGAAAQVAPYFADPEVGAVQVSVRINNRRSGLLARMQDMEFVVFSSVFQVARNRRGNAGLGGNGQFTRLSALQDLGSAPWSNVLTEDLDLGIRMQLNGWLTLHCPDVEVHQQGLTHMGRLVRQRSRWFQGHLQSWRLVPDVVRRTSGRFSAETLHVLLMPFLVLLSSLMTLSFIASVVGVAVSPVTRHQLITVRTMVFWYLLTFAPGLLFGYVYSRRTREGSLVRSLLRGHAFILYGLIWMVSGWWAVGRTLRRRDGWLKTARIAESRDAAPDGVSAAAQPKAFDADVDQWPDGDERADAIHYETSSR